MAVNKKKDRRGVQHTKGSFIKKSGPKPKRAGKACSPAKLQQQCAWNKALWKIKIPQLIATLALQTGESMDGGEARIALRVTLQVIDEAELIFDTDAERVQDCTRVLCEPMSSLEAALQLSRHSLIL